jgi:ABC-type multidrug transport system fused ATPase/permease subunit
VIDTGLTDGNDALSGQCGPGDRRPGGLAGVFTFLRAYLFQYLAERVGYDLRNELYDKFQALPFSFMTSRRPGQLRSRATDDVNNIRGMLMMSLRALVLTFGMLVAVAAILLYTDWQLALIALASMPVLVWWSLKFGVTVRPDVRGGAAAVWRHDLGLAGEHRLGRASSRLRAGAARERALRGRAAGTLPAQPARDEALVLLLPLGPLPLRAQPGRDPLARRLSS